MPHVTVVMATHNWSTVLPYSIGSVLRQTFSDFELLVVGDGCTDDSESVVAAVGDPRVRWINFIHSSRILLKALLMSKWMVTVVIRE